MATIKTKSEAVALAKKLVPERSDSDGSVIDLLIALGVWTPEPEPVVEKTPWELFKSKFCWRSDTALANYSDDDEHSSNVVYDVKQAIGAAGLKLIKAGEWTAIERALLKRFGGKWPQEEIAPGRYVDVDPETVIASLYSEPPIVEVETHMAKGALFKLTKLNEVECYDAVRNLNAAGYVIAKRAGA